MNGGQLSLDPDSPFTAECQPDCTASIDERSNARAVYVEHADGCPHAPVQIGYSLAEAAADEGMGRAYRGAPEQWRMAAGAVIAELARWGAPFTTDEVWERVPAPPEPRALGAAIKRASKAGVIVATGDYRASKRVECHGRPVRIWRGVRVESR